MTADPIIDDRYIARDTRPSRTEVADFSGRGTNIPLGNPSLSAQSDSDAVLEDIYGTIDFAEENSGKMTPGDKMERYFMALENYYAMKMAEYQNHYNSPAEQMKRYQKAGLNPNMIYSKDNMSAQPQNSGHNTPNRAQNIIGGIGQALEFIRTGLDLRMQKAQISSIESQNAERAANTAILVESVETQKNTNKKILEEIENLKTVRKNTDVDTDNKKIEGALLEAEQKRIPLRDAMAKLQLTHEEKEIAKISQEIVNLIAQKEDITFTAALKRYEYDNLKPLEEKILSEDLRLKSFDNDMNYKYGEIDRLTEGNGPIDRLIRTASRVAQKDIKILPDLYNSHQRGTRRR